ncbi:MAG: alpha-glucosidase [Leptospiraceae bacterium]|nr:alpha-glucosidase [Leptospiraceae bacterium]
MYRFWRGCCRIFFSGIGALCLSASACGRADRVNLAADFPQQLSIKSLSLSLAAGKNYLHLVHTAQNRTLLRLALDRPFLSARRARDLVRESFASYRMDEAVEENCDSLLLKNAVVQDDNIVITGQLSCAKAKSGVVVKIEPLGTGVRFSARLDDARLNRLTLSFLAENNESVFGGGEQFTYLNLRGHRVHMLSEEQGIGRGLQPITTGADLRAGSGGTPVSTYAPVPFFFTSAYRAFATDNLHYQTWDFSTGIYSVDIWAPEISIDIDTFPSYAAMIARYTARTGRMQPLPDWASGTVLGVQGGKDRVESILKAAVDAGNPVTAIWIQDWVGRRETSFGSQLWWRWLPDEASYPNFRAWVADLSRRNVKVLGYVNPFLADSGPIFEEALQRGFLVRNPRGQAYKIQTAGFPAYLIDLSNAEARAFIKKVIRTQLIDAGLAGYMADFGEWLPWDAVLASGESSAQWHNRYPVEWAKLNREVIREAGLEGKVIFFTRSGHAGSAEHSTLFWAGDQLVTFDEYDGLASAVTALLSSGISGMALNHSDIGGYTTIDNPLRNYHRTRELTLRWAEFAVFTPFFRTHEGNRPLRNDQVYSDAAITRDFAALGRLHLRLKLYFDELMREAADTGMPLIRPLFLHYPQDHNTFDLRHQFMLGRDLIVAPVIIEGSKEGSVYLPKGGWIESSTLRRIDTAGWHRFDAPLGKPVVFIRADASRFAGLKTALSPEK